MSQLPSEKEFQDWLLHPVTRAFREGLRLNKESLKNQWEAGMFQSASEVETAQANGQALAQIKLINDWLDFDYSEFISILEGEEDD